MNFGVYLVLMKSIKDFRINLNLDSLENVKKIKENIENFVSEKCVKESSASISKLLDIPIEIVNKKIKQIIYNNFDYYDKEPKFKLKYSFLSSSKYFLMFVLLLIFKKKLKPKNNKKKVDIILDNVEKYYVLEKFNKTLSHFDSTLVIHNEPLLKKKYFNNNTFFCYTHSFLFSNEILKRKTTSFLKLIFELFYLSKKNKINFLKIFFIVFYSCLKYYRIFNIYKSKLLIHDRIYHSCPIRNYIFQKTGGKKIVCLQSHLAEGTVSVFNDIDTLVTFGKETDTKKKLELLGGKINDIVYCGSIRMEHALSNFKKVDEIDQIDILLIGINLANWVGTSKEIINIYYKHFEWISEISKKYPKLNILIKHHPNYKPDNRERKIIKETNIKTIINPENNLNSYHFLFKSNLILSFGSTMILEGLGAGKNCFYLDPGAKNTTFFKNLDYLNKIRVTKFEDLEILVQKYLINKKSIIKVENDNFCLSHSGASQNLYEYLSKYNNYESKNFE